MRAGGEEALRRVFAKFDHDGSGMVSASELEMILATCSIDLPKGELERIMRDADKSGDGQVSFDEFFEAVERSGRDGGGMAAVVSQSSSFLGWLNPLSWLTSTAPVAPASAGALSARSSVGTASTKHRRPSSASSISVPPGARRSVLSQKSAESLDYVQQRNAQAAEDLRHEESEREGMRRERQQQFMARQQQRIRHFRQQEVRTSHPLYANCALHTCAFAPHDTFELGRPCCCRSRADVCTDDTRGRHIFPQAYSSSTHATSRSCTI